MLTNSMNYKEINGGMCMLAQYLWVKWVGMIIKATVYMGVLLLIFFSMEKSFNITFSYLSILLGGIIFLIIAEIVKYRKWLQNGANF